MKKDLKGNVSLTVVIVTGTILLIMGITVLMASIDLARSSNDTVNYELNLMRSRSCIEEGLNRLKGASTFTGTITITYTDGNCSGVVANDPGNNPSYKQITVTSVLGSFTAVTVKKVNLSTSPFTVMNP